MSIWKKENTIYYNKKQFEQLIPLCDQDGDIYKGRDGKIYRDPFLGKAIKIYHDHRSLTNAMNAFSFSSFYEAYTQALKNLSCIAKEEVLVYDMHENNIMYDIKNNCFKFIDIDEWERSNLTLVSTVKHNVKEFISSINLDKIKMKLKD